MTWAGKSLRRVYGWLLLGGMFFVSGVQGVQAAGAAPGADRSSVSANMAPVSSGPAGMPARAPSLSSQIWGDHTDVSLGVMLGTRPTYMGAKETQGGVEPFFSVSRGIFFFDPRGIGVQYGSDDGLMASLSIGADPGRSEKKSSAARLRTAQGYGYDPQCYYDQPHAVRPCDRLAGIDWRRRVSGTRCAARQYLPCRV